MCHLGWLGFEAAWQGPAPPVLHAQLHWGAALLGTIPLVRSHLLGLRTISRELRALMKEPIVYHEVEKRVVEGEWGIKLVRTMWQQSRFRKIWERERSACKCPYRFYSGYITARLHPVPEHHSCRHYLPPCGLGLGPGQLRVTVQLPDARGNYMHHLPWYLYGRNWVWRQRADQAAVLVRGTTWDLKTIGREAERERKGWCVEGWV